MHFNVTMEMTTKFVQTFSLNFQYSHTRQQDRKNQNESQDRSHGIPDVFMTDNGPAFKSEDFDEKNYLST